MLAFKRFSRMTAEDHLRLAARFQRLANMTMGRRRREELRSKADLHLQAAKVKQGES